MHLQALSAGAEEISKVCEQIQTWADKIGKPKRTDITPADTSFDEEVASSSLPQDIKEEYLKNLGRLSAALICLTPSLLQKSSSDCY